MKIYIVYEKYNIEFYGKYILSKYLISKVPAIKEITVGYYRDLILKILASDHIQGPAIFISNNIYKNSQALIDLMTMKNISYLSFHEEEHYLYTINNKRSFFNISLDKNYFSKLERYLALSKVTKNSIADFYNTNNITLAGNPKYEFLKLINKFPRLSNKITKKRDFIFIPLPESYFRALKYYRIYLKRKKKLNKNEFLGHNNIYEMVSFYFYLKKFIKEIFKFSKQNRKEKIIVRLHPSDIEYEHLIKKIFKNYKNIELNSFGQIHPWIKESKIVVCYPGSPVIDTLLLNKNCKIFYDKKNFYHNFLFKKHPSIKNKKLLIKNFTKKSLVKKLNKNIQLEKFTNFEKNNLKVVSEILKKTRIKKQSKFKTILFELFLKKPINIILKNKKNRLYGYSGFYNYSQKFRYSLRKILLFFLFYRNSQKKRILDLMYKFCLGNNKNINEFHIGKGEEIDIKYVNFLERYLRKKINYFKDSKAVVDRSKKTILFKKTQ